ncbi:MAG: XdhC family protein [Acidobacteriota bacterium]
MNPDFYRELNELLARHPALAVATIVRSRGSSPRHAGTRMIVLPDGSTRHSIGGGKFEDLVIQQTSELLRRGGDPELRTFPFRPEGPGAFGVVCGGEAEVFMEVIRQAPRLVIVGAGHCGQALARAASLLDYRILVVEDRPEYSDPSLFAGARVEQVVCAGEGFDDFPDLHPDDIVVLVSRSHLIDATVLRRLLDQPLAYLGMIGSRRRVETIYRSLREEGVSAEAFAHVHAPIGIELGAETPAEIAVSILAEIIRARRLGASKRTASGGQTPEPAIGG